MPFINAEPCLGIVSSYRLIWIRGKFGGHKTSFAYALAEPYLKQGYRLITNSRSVWADDLSDVDLDENGQLKAIVILDEGGLYFKASRQIEQIAAYCAKMDIIIIIPSYFAPARTAQTLTIQPLFSLKSAGLPVIFYKWNVNQGGFKDKGWFIWTFPQLMYGIYSRQDPGDEPSKIVDFLIDKMTQFRKRYGYNDKVSTMEQITPEEIFSDSINILSEDLNGFSATLPKRKYFKR